MMNRVLRYIFILSLLVAAVVMYSLGSIHELFILLVLGFGFEIAFWLFAFKDHKKAKQKASMKQQDANC
ncbi:hypothetical protein LP316_01425 [Thalassotalea sp. LPB0316]|uniref:hypothetical protein n=1 Tax=Thalassotalea sp. LPB0316 TaxID=2769490 RepID=UPI001867A92C|nr:hypothetical protein [Thalassotalea sp. LPB0316]QOL26002.1 hypothetical protein LP316_01425 [Thalassotalea sp. LPB0316]